MRAGIGRDLERACPIRIRTILTDRAMGYAIDRVDGACSRRRDAPVWGCRPTPGKRAIHARDYRHRP